MENTTQIESTKKSSGVKLYTFGIIGMASLAVIFLLGILIEVIFKPGLAWEYIFPTLLTLFAATVSFTLVSNLVFDKDTNGKWNIDEFIALAGLIIAELYFVYVLIFIYLPEEAKENANFGTVTVSTFILVIISAVVYMATKEVKTEKTGKNGGFFN